jgi:two-component system chemotaxis response regulator CheB
MNAPVSQPAIIVIGASAGGIEPLIDIMRHLPADLPAAVCVVVHFPATATSLLPQILQRAGPLPAVQAEDGQRLQSGHVYVAPPDRHLLVRNGGIALSRGPRQNGHRPAIDPMFQSAARGHGRRVVGVILSGTLDDGTLGLNQVRAHGGLTVVQDPADAVFDAMPRNAIAATPPDFVLPAAEIGAALARLAHELVALPEEPLAEKEAPIMQDPSLNNNEASIVANDKAQLERHGRSGEPTLFTCPDCGGVLWEINDADLLRYRCHVGHAYSAEGLRAEQSEELEEALWTAVRSLEESASLARRLAFRARSTNSERTAEHFEARALEDEQRADLVRQALARGAAPPATLQAALAGGSGNST